MGLRDEVDGYFAKVHSKTPLGVWSSAIDGDITINGDDPESLRETLNHLLGMVDALEETVKLLATVIDKRP